VLLLGVLLRVLGYFGGIEFWLDEALWATIVGEGRAAPLRPPGWVWVSRWLVDLRNTEPVIRAPSLIAGILSLPVFVAVCRRAGLSRLATLFGLFVLAVHPAAIDMTKEFKPYALELFLHLMLLWLAFSFLRSPQTWRIVVLGLAAMAAAPFSWSVAVLYPGLFTVAGVSALRRRHVRQVAAAVGGAGATLATALIGFVQHRQGRVPDTQYWGGKYDILYLGSDLQGAVSWLLEKTWAVATFPAHLESFWLDPTVVEVFWTLQGVLCAVGVVLIGASRRWDWSALWLSPWMVTVAFNLLGWWPYGVFRSNLFLLAYSLLVSLAALDGLWRWGMARATSTRPAWGWPVPVFCALFVLAFLPFDLSYFAKGKGSAFAANCHVRHAFEVIYEAEHDEAPPEKPRRFIMDIHASYPFDYYRNVHPVTSEKYKEFLRERYRKSRRYQPLKQAVDRQVDRGFWLLVCHPLGAADLREYVLERCPDVDYLEEFRHGGLLLRCRESGDRAPLDKREHGDR
jgi:hypothetical protein